jgi:hypothetical protein
MKKVVFIPVKLMITTKEGERYIQNYLPTEYEFSKVVWKKMHSSRPDLLEIKRDELRGVEKRAAKIANKITSFQL